MKIIATYDIRMRICKNNKQCWFTFEIKYIYKGMEYIVLVLSPKLPSDLSCKHSVPHFI
jgi:hypothetical protein